MASARNPWEIYKVGKPSTKPNWINPDCTPLKNVTHVSHVDAALRILQARKLRNGLVFDESQLNTERVLVNWLSPNHWAEGYRYGNVAFTFGFTDLIRGKKYYWVEAMTGYHPHACRILITSTDRSARLQPYDPTLAVGPWWHDRSTDTHYYNGKFCLEFMLESDLAIKRVSRVDFVAHHDVFCSMREADGSCGQIGLTGGKGGALFLMTAAARATDLSPLTAALIAENSLLSDRVKHAAGYIVPRRFAKLRYLRKVKAQSNSGRALARAVLGALAAGQPSEADSLAALFWSEDTVMVAISDVLAKTLGWAQPADILDAMKA